jgi:hypothetical protein
LALGSSPAERAAARKIETATGLLRLSKRDQVRDLVSNCQSIYCAKTRPVDAAHRQEFPHPNWSDHALGFARAAVVQAVFGDDERRSNCLKRASLLFPIYIPSGLTCN